MIHELKKQLQWLAAHNKNYTKEQYYKITECLDILEQVSAKDLLNDIYIEYLNNYLTIPVFAENEGLTVLDAGRILGIGRSIHKGEYKRMEDY